jgi:DNA-binding IclR family transcriptional regulator
MRVLGLLRRNPGLRVPAIAKATGCSPATVKRAIAALQEADPVEFRGSPKTGGYCAVVEPDDRSEFTQNRGGADGQKA